MNCPNCGAALRAIPNRSHLRCDHCTSLHFPETTCEGVVVLEGEHEQPCPCCKAVLRQALLDGEGVGFCLACRGILLGSEHFARALAARRAERGQRQVRLEPIDPTELHRPVRCPKCEKRMDTHPYGGGGNAVIDSCHRCRLVWLDAGEFSLLERFAPALR